MCVVCVRCVCVRCCVCVVCVYVCVCVCVLCVCVCCVCVCVKQQGLSPPYAVRSTDSRTRTLAASSLSSSAACAVGETVVLLQPPLHLAGVQYGRRGDVSGMTASPTASARQPADLGRRQPWVAFPDLATASRKRWRLQLRRELTAAA